MHEPEAFNTRASGDSGLKTRALFECHGFEFARARTKVDALAWGLRGQNSAGGLRLIDPRHYRSRR